MITLLRAKLVVVVGLSAAAAALVGCDGRGLEWLAEERGWRCRRLERRLH